MPVYRLTPLKGSERSPQWRASSMRPYCLWISAADESAARLLVAKATAVSLDDHEPQRNAPWQDADLVACEYDDSKRLADGIIYVRRQPEISPSADGSRHTV